MLAAIMDGTLEPGERLNDDELTKWLGVSRTPVREAIARLADWGLVDMEPNRYTRIAEADEKVYAEADQYLGGLHSLALEWSAGRLSTAQKKTVAKSLSDAEKAIKNEDPAGVLALLDAYGETVLASGNDLFIAAELPLRTRVKFLTPKDAGKIDWTGVAVSADRLKRAVS
ncbi:hypothetical protein ASF54_03310 [Frondihabitans sp. Leaf304]|nr:hypothetical protein ASF54_03310 [Frondihabitans sp. Leaf304]